MHSSKIIYTDKNGKKYELKYPIIFSKKGCEHTRYQEKASALPTCTEQGYSSYTCRDCGHTYFDYVAALGHDWGEGWYTVIEPTCTKTGTKRRGCSRCDAYETETVAALGHSWSDWGFDMGTGMSYRKCEVCGTIEESKILEFISIGGSEYSVRASRTDLSGVVEIPSLDGKVKSIYKDGFKNCTGIKYIVLPDSITTIAQSAFENCYDLERVQIGRESKLTLIDTYAFYNCYSLTQIVLPKSLDYVGLGAFNNKWCAFLYEGNSTDWKTYAPTVALCPVITDNLYYYTDNSVSAAGSSDTYWKYVDNSPEIVYGASDVGHFTFTELDDGTYSVKATDVSKLPEYVYIPKEYNGKAVTKIDESGFAYNKKVKLYEIPDTIVEIGTGAFYQNISLSKVRFSFGSRLKTIGIEAFGYNKQLATLSSPKASIGEVPSCVTTMLYNAFYHCEKLTKAVIPPKVTTAHEFVFIGCTSVETIELNNVKHINRSAFWECSPISLDIPASVEFIDNTAFGNCSETLERITVDEDNQYYYAEGNCLIRKSDNALLLGCVNSEIPSSVTKILPGAFYGVKGVVITIPSTVTEIESGAFVESPNTTIRVPMHEAPMQWDINWCDDTVKVIWGYTEGGDTCTHSYTSVVTSPTCTEQGYTTYTCSKCGHSYVGDYVDALGHKEIIDPAVPATCTTNGKTQGSHCSRCGIILVPQVIIRAYGHDWEDATCTKPKTCKTCGLTEGEALGHTWVEADCDTPKTCSVCGATEGSALGHTWSTWSIVTTPTCTKFGMNRRECSVCGAFETQTVEALGHNYGEWSITLEPTCTETGTRRRDCFMCDAYETETIAALGHISSDWIIDVEATETAEGSKHKECTRCGVVLETATIPMLDNNTYLVTESGEYLTDEQGNLLIL